MPLSSTFLVCQEHVETRLRESLTPTSTLYPLTTSPSRHLATSLPPLYILQPCTLYLSIYPTHYTLPYPFLTFFQCFPRSDSVFLRFTVLLSLCLFLILFLLPFRDLSDSLLRSFLCHRYKHDGYKRQRRSKGLQWI